MRRTFCMAVGRATTPFTLIQRRSLHVTLRALQGRLTSPALEAAMRLTQPSVETPATGDASKVLVATDPQVEWREHWSIVHDMPYYHNLVSHEVTWDVPEGFPTRFKMFHARNENILIDAEGRVQIRTTGTDSQAASTAGTPLTLKKRLALYGSGGLLLYLIIHNICLAIVFIGIYALGWDLVGVAQSYGFNIKREDKQDKKSGLIGTFVTAVLLNKCTVPLQLAATLLLAPRFVPLLTPFANRVFPVIRSWIPFLKQHSKVGVRVAAAKTVAV